MKKLKLHIRFAWIILICFIAGQTMVYSHQHHTNFKLTVSHLAKSGQPGQTVSEKCDICDMMHHTQMAIFSNGYTNPLVTVCNTHYTRQHNYVGIALILSAGRSPPVA